jgi:NAD(P)-dependent dehydrogenase (short-subunit alcohol dehydrogenase family)
MPENLAYRAFQAAIMTYTKGLAREVTALEIRVNGIA